MSSTDQRDSGFTGELEIGRLFDRFSRAEWEGEAGRSLKGRPLASLAGRSHEGLAVAPLYDLGDAREAHEYPGLAPYSRGGRATTRGGWEVCQPVADGSPETASAALADELGRGVGALWVRLDRPVRLGKAPDAPEARGWPVDGVVAGTSADLGRLLDGVDLTTTPVRLSGGGNGVAVAAGFIAAAAASGHGPSTVRGSFGFDPLSALAEDGELTAGMDGSMELLADVVAWTSRNAPGVRSMAISTVPYHLAGATAVHEIAYTLATGVEYLRRLEGAGVPLERACLQLRLVTAIGRDLLMEVAKLRALRRTWSRVVEVCGGSPEARRAPLHALTSPRTLTVRDPWVNILRATVETFAAAVGGADAITCLPFDAAIGPPSDPARRLAANTHTILREEAHLDQVADPGGGSFALERLTDDLAEAAWAAFQKLEREGGMAAALVGGEIGRELARVHERKRAAVATRRDPVTGVSTWPKLDERPVVRPSVDGASLREQAGERVAARRCGDGPPTELGKVADAVRAARADGSAFAAAVEAAAAGATFSELSSALRGDHRPVTVVALAAHREAEPFERLRAASDAWMEAHGSRPRVFLANLGPVAAHTARAAFARNLFEAGGFEAQDSDGSATAEQAVAAFRASGADSAVICGPDQLYDELVAPVAAGLRVAGARTVVVAGRPGEREALWREAGVDRFVFLGCDAASTLEEMLAEAGVLHD